MGYRSKKSDWVENDDRRFECGMPPFDIDQKLEKAGITNDKRLIYFGGSVRYRTEDKTTLITVNKYWHRDKMREHFSPFLNDAFGDWKILVFKAPALLQEAAE